MYSIPTIDSPKAIEQTALRIGILPFFRCRLSGFSIEEHTPHHLYFVKDVEGPWEWKGPVIKNGRCVYGKFFDRKAAFVDLGVYQHLANYRRSVSVLSPMAYKVLEVICANEGLLTTDIRTECGLDRPTSKMDILLGNNNAEQVNLDTLMMRLMMSGHVVIEDFEYKIDKRGKPYGWGVARYTTPEILYAGRFELPNCTPKESRDMIIEKLVETIGEENRGIAERMVMISGEKWRV